MLRSFRICFIDYFIFLSTIAVFISGGFGSKLKKITAATAWNISKYRFSVTRIFPYKDKIIDSVLIRENTGQRKLVCLYILRSELFKNKILRKIVSMLWYSYFCCLQSSNYCYVWRFSWIWIKHIAKSLGPKRYVDFQKCRVG